MNIALWADDTRVQWDRSALNKAKRGEWDSEDVLGRNIDNKEVKAIENKYKIGIDLIDGNAYYRKKPSLYHERAKSALVRLFNRTIFNQGHVMEFDNMNVTLELNANTRYEADAGFYLCRGRPNGGANNTDLNGVAYPTVIIEVRKTNLSLSDFFDKIDRHFEGII